VNRHPSACAGLLVAAGLFVASGPAVALADEAAPNAASTVVTPAALPAAQPETRTVVAGKEFDRNGKWRFWFGEGYRMAWTTPVEAPVLDLATEAGGLTPLRQVGGFQTEGLAMKAANGAGYTFRKLEKHPERVLPKEWQDSDLRGIAVDQTAAAHPAATVIVGTLAQAVGIPSTARASPSCRTTPPSGNSERRSRTRSGSTAEHDALHVRLRGRLERSADGSVAGRQGGGHGAQAVEHGEQGAVPRRADRLVRGRRS